MKGIIFITSFPDSKLKLNRVKCRSIFPSHFNDGDQSDEDQDFSSLEMCELMFEDADYSWRLALCRTLSLLIETNHVWKRRFNTDAKHGSRL